MAAYWKFFRSFLKSPAHVGGILPSSRTLAIAIADAVRQLRQNEATPLVEVGPGTGALTRELIHLGDPLFLLERNPEFAQELAHRFPQVKVHCDDFLTSDLFSKLSGGAVLVSSLPIRSLPEPDRFRARFQQLIDSGSVRAVVQFSYGLRDPLGFKHHEVETIRYRFIFKNFPPAFIWVYHARKAN